jgi:hypothetical protein
MADSHAGSGARRPEQDGADHGPDAHGAFDPTPIDALPADEAPTPAWVPVVGLGLALAGGLGWLALGRNAASGEPGAGAAASVSGAVPAPTAAASAGRAPQGVVLPQGIPSALDRLSPERRREIGAQMRRELGAGAAASAPPAGSPR